MPVESLQTRIIKILRSIILDNDSLSMFMNSFAFGKVITNGAFVMNGKVKFFRNETEDKLDFERDRTDSFKTSAIRICDFTPRDISERALVDNYEYNNTKFFFQYIYNRWEDRNISNQMGINVSRKANIKGYILNFLDVKKLMVTQSQVRNNYGNGNYGNVFNSFYFVGPKNSLLAISTVSGLMYIRQQCLVKLFDNNDMETITRTLKNLLICFKQQLDKFSEINIKQFRDEIADVCETNLFMKIVNDDRFSGHYYRSYGETETPQQFMTNIKLFIKESIKTATSGTIFGVKDSYSYGTIINSILSAKKESEQAVFQKGFQKGMQIGLKIEMLGWRPSTVNFPDENSASMWWEKEVNIVPDNFMWQRERYSIPEKHRCYKIDKMYVSQDGVLRCHGTHPNVQGSRVCMGDLSIRFSDELSNIQDVLKRAEELLDMINFDSAYHNDKRDQLIKVSVKNELLNDSSKFKEEKKKSTSIRVLGKLSDADDDEDEEEIVEVKKPAITVKTIKDKKHVIAEITNFPIPKTTAVADEDTNYRRYGNRYGAPEVDESEQAVSTHTDVPVYITNDVVTLSEITHVNSEGERRPVVFVAGPSTEVLTPALTPVSIIRDTEELSLGDSNIMV